VDLAAVAAHLPAAAAAAFIAASGAADAGVGARGLVTAPQVHVVFGGMTPPEGECNDGAQAPRTLLVWAAE
jgi:hypothetical protein